jgi:hypothetical protein
MQQADGGRPRARLITVAWGDGYVAELFDVTLAAALAPGNLPAVVELLDCDVVILTEAARFDELRNHPVFRGLQRLCPVELRPVDEFVTRPDAYGMALTYALFRGLEDFGEDMVNVHLLFLNSDFVLADGSFRTVARKILDGERLILAPSYCVVGEALKPELDRWRDRDTATITVPPRELAALGIRNRHNTIRGKTINQQLFSMEWIDQFYWLVDQETILARQLPIAVVSMRPERVLTEMVTFWDYGIISHACPTTPRCVISDSDDFLMIELRNANTARDQIRLGRPSPEQIARKLYRFITADPIELARHPLVWHSADLPDLSPAAAELDRYVSTVLAYLPKPMDYRDHYIWRYHYPTFHKLRDAYLTSQGAPLASNFEGLEENPPHPAEEALDAAFVAYSGGSARQTAAILSGDTGSRHAPPSASGLPDLTPVWRALEDQARGRVLILNSHSLGVRLFGSAKGSPVEFDGLPFWLDAYVSEGPANLQALPRFSTEDWCDLCLCEIDSADFLRLRNLLDTLSDVMCPGSKIYLFYLNPQTGPLVMPAEIVESDGLALEFPARVSFVGLQPEFSYPKESMPDVPDGAAQIGSARSFLNFLRGGTCLGPGETRLAVFDEPPDRCLGMIVEIEVTLRQAGPRLVIKPRPFRAIRIRTPVDAPDPPLSADQGAAEEVEAKLASMRTSRTRMPAELRFPLLSAHQTAAPEFETKRALVPALRMNKAVDISRLLLSAGQRTATALGSQLASVSAEKESLTTKLASLQEDMNGVLAKLTLLQVEKDSVIEERARLISELGQRMAAERGTLRGQIARLEQELSMVRTVHVTRVGELEQELSMVRTVHVTRVGELEEHNRVLTETATEYARQLQERADTNYQILMAQQQMLAGMKDADPQFLDIYERCKDYTMTSVERLYALYKGVEYVVKAGIEGDFVETGVWRGGSCMLIAETLMALSDRARRIFLFDTFEGHPKPDAEKDIDIWGNRAIEDWERHQATSEAWGYASLDETRANLAQTGYPTDRIVFFKGMVEETIPQIVEVGPLALMRLDTDWYQSACVSLKHLFPRLAEGGVLIMDDYGHYKGQQQALDEYLAATGQHLLLNRIDYSCRVAIKGRARP